MEASGVEVSTKNSNNGGNKQSGIMGGMMKTGFGNGVKPPQEESDLLPQPEPTMFNVNTSRFLIVYNLLNCLLYSVSIILFVFRPNLIEITQGVFYSFTPITLLTQIGSFSQAKLVYSTLSGIFILIHLIVALVLAFSKNPNIVSKLIYILSLPWIMALIYNIWSSNVLFALGAGIFPFVILLILNWNIWNYARWLKETDEKKKNLELTAVASADSNV
ncbi:hypothetical protein HDU92_007326 [Lobulomyces angularis]|nr:hypothetical protein HDU92_007326 [Lobulomyces angularis]